jgi:hypothetical protein
VTPNAAQFAFTANRTPKLPNTLTCALAAPPAPRDRVTPCRLPGPAGRQTGTSYSGLANGIVTVTLRRRNRPSHAALQGQRPGRSPLPDHRGARTIG